MEENGKKFARRSFGKLPYECKKDWPEDCFVQCGGNGIVLPSGAFEKVMALKPLTKDEEKKTYVTAFFEAFPKDPSTFIRGEGKSIEEAEEKAWTKWERYLACNNHEFERRGYTNGAGFCKHCGLFKSKAFDPNPRPSSDEGTYNKTPKTKEGKEE